jgi:hypothetical protein
MTAHDGGPLVRRATGSTVASLFEARARIVRDNLETFLAWACETYEAPLPRYVENELRAYLRCGVFRHGFVRCHCDACGHDLFVAFSCKGRGICPSCAGRRMANTAARLVDRVLPDVPVRQYVLSLPFELRALAAFDARALGVFARDGVQRVAFSAAPAPTRAELDAIVRRVRDRSLAWLRRRGLLDERPLEERSNEALAPGPINACAVIAMQRGTVKMLSIETGDDDAAGGHGEAPAEKTELAVERDGFNLHAGVRIEAGDDLGRERLCRYGARPPLSLERLRRLPGGRVAYRVKYMRRGHAKHRVMTGIELLARLSALIPPPRYPLVRFHGVLAPKSSWRKDVVPKPRAPESLGQRCAEKRPARSALYAATPRIDWATLLRRAFDVDVLACAKCGGRLRVLGCVTDPDLGRAILERLAIPAEAPRVARARDPTDDELTAGA